MTEQQIREQIARLEATQDDSTAAGLKLAAVTAAHALRWAVGDADRAPADILAAR